MKLGTQISDNLSGSKYPFAEDSEVVSAYTVDQKQERGKLPCDLFSDVVVDADFGKDESFVVWAVHGDEGVIDFARWDNVKAENNESYVPEILFSASKPDFDKFGRLLYVSNDVFVRIETKHRNDFDDVVKYAASVLVQGDPEDPGDEDQILPSVLYGPIHFDSRCTRKPEKRLQAFAVHGSIVQGDVKFMPGYNVAIERPILGVDNSLSIRAEGGAGEGRVPCSEAYVDGNSSGLVGLTPGADGDIRIETDGCYSIAPMSERLLKIMGHCRSCCSCEGDYLPAANSVNKLILRMNAAYEALSDINRNYNELIRSTAEKIKSMEIQPDLLVAVARTRASGETNRFRTKVDISFLNKTSNDLQILSVLVRLSSSVNALADFSSDSNLVPEDDKDGINAKLEDVGIVETVRSLQVGDAVFENTVAVISEPMDLPAGSALYASTSSRAVSVMPRGQALYNAPDITVQITYRKGTNGVATTIGKTAKFK